VDLINLLSELRAEARRINEAIAAIERLVTPGAKRRGRPPKTLSAGADSGSAHGPDIMRQTVRSKRSEEESGK